MNKDRILSAARQELCRNGFEGTTLRAVAHRAGVDARLVSYYFAGKEQLCTEAVRLPWDSPSAGRAALAAALTHRPSAARLSDALGSALGEMCRTAGARDPELGAATTASVLLGLALLSCAGVPSLDPPGPGTAAAVSQYIGFLLEEAPS
ncbi:TetR family transcriptional regulator [Streptomyces sp. NBC_01352]|uniref:HTH tetR-type domain-containing protein n=1 Tax=Streptomyces plumbiresistens TaxID=511811 RepID=A0ABP7TGM7_9ACTN|nr:MULTISPECIES: helix-turn-helix domain-containing protein [unclassified Streptomyces]MCX4700854.1 TetR family transcriptional regulator [Streptomyces sp. NBC_01373]